MRQPIDLSLYLVTKRAALTLDDFFRIIRASIEGGVKIVQLREKDASVREMVAIGKSLLSFLRPLGVPLIINDRVDVARAVNADGVHLGQSDLSVEEARAMLGKQAIIGLSVETIEQGIAAREEDVDYLAASPVFHSKSKFDCGAPWGLNGLKHLCSLSSHPIVAIGGIDETNVEKVLECGAAGIAVVSALFDASCPKTAALTLTNKMKGGALRGLP